MDKNGRRIILAYIYLGMAIACCVFGIISLINDLVGPGVILMACMFGLAFYVDGMFSTIRTELEHDKVENLKKRQVDKRRMFY